MVISGTAISIHQREQRFVLLDTLRGVAAVVVLLFHALTNTVMSVPLERVLPTIIKDLFLCGSVGVKIFFVLSGFVIAHSLRANSLSWEEIKRFVLRRQLRLDPPYWAVIVLSLSLYHLEMAVPGLVSRAEPARLKDVLINLFYLQMIVPGKQIVGVAWTLCIEVQFYLAFILLLKIGQITKSRVLSSDITKTTIFLIAALGMYSVVSDARMTLKSPGEAWYMHHWSPWFTLYWCDFAAGVLCYWVVQDKVKPMVYSVFMSLFALCILPAAMITVRYHGLGSLFGYGVVWLSGWATSLLLYHAGSRGKLTVWGANPILQYLGKISYSLYLVHLMIISVVLRLGYKLTGANQMASLFWLAAAVGLSIAAAHVLYRCVELPSIRFAARFKASEKRVPDEQ